MIELPQGQFLWLIVLLIVFGYITGRLHEYLYGRWAYRRWQGLLEQAKWMEKKLETDTDGTFFDGSSPVWEDAVPRVTRDKGWKPYKELPNDIRERPDGIHK